MTLESNKSHLVTVIIATYNSAGTLKLTLKSVLAQDHVDFEVLVVGDGCTDDSAAVTQSFGDPRVRWLGLPENSGGPSTPRNRGLREAKGTYVAYLGHDDLWFPWHLSALVAFIQDRQVDLVASLGLTVAPAGVLGSFSLPQEPWRRKSPITPSNWLHHVNVIGRVGPWSTSIRMGHDREFLQRVLQAGVPSAPCCRLSVLKFPATHWNMYALTSDYPQTTYVEAMQQDPAALQLQMLQDLAFSAALARGRPRAHRGRPLKSLFDMVVGAAYKHQPLRSAFDRLEYDYWRGRTGLDKMEPPSS